MSYRLILRYIHQGDSSKPNVYHVVCYKSKNTLHLPALCGKQTNKQHFFSIDMYDDRYDSKELCLKCVQQLILGIAKNHPMRHMYRSLLADFILEYTGRSVLSANDVFDYIIETLQTVRDYTIKDPDKMTALRDAYIKRFYTKNKSTEKLGDWNAIINELNVLIDHPIKDRFFKNGPEIAGLIAAIAKIKKPQVEESLLTELQFIKICTLAQTKSIELDGDIEALSVEDGDNLIEWLREIVIK